MSPHEVKRLVGTGIIPIYIDVTREEVARVLFQTKHLPVFFVSSMDIRDAILAIDPDSPVEYITQSASDALVRRARGERVARDVALLQYGRQNKVLHAWAMAYAKEHPELEYIWQNNGVYRSTVRGEIENFPTREAFLRLLRRTKICLMSTPGMTGDDQSRFFGEGIDYFTARWFESAAMGCRLVGRYTRRAEAQYLKIASVCPFADSYETFARLVTEQLARSEDAPSEAEQAFLQANVTSTRVREVIALLEKHGVSCSS